MRDLLLQLAVTDLYKARWTRRDRAALERTRELMERAIRDALVTGYEAICRRCNCPGCVQKVRHRLTKPPYTVDEYLDTPTRNGLVARMAELRPFSGLL